MMAREWSDQKKVPEGIRTREEPALLECFSGAILAKSQKGPGAGFDPRKIKTSYADFVSILGEFHKKGTDPLGLHHFCITLSQTDLAERLTYEKGHR